MLLLLFALISIGFSFFCSIWEAVLLSIPASFVEIKRAEGQPFAEHLAKLKQNIDEPLSAILSLNTIAHTVGAVGVGAMAEDTFGSGKMVIIGYELPFSIEAVVATVMTLAILVFSEIIPKTIGATYWKKLVPFTTRSLWLVMIVMKPFIWLSQLITKMLKGDELQKSISREELSVMGKIGHREGVFNEDESKIIHNLMRFSQIRADSIMTPRSVVAMASEELTIREYFEKHQPIKFSRIPVFGENSESITGYVLKDVILEYLIKDNGNSKLKEISRPISAFSYDLSIRKVFTSLLSKREQIAVVYDSYGSLAGIVTLEDVIETLLGLEIVDETDAATDMQELARQNWQERAKKMGLIEK